NSVNLTTFSICTEQERNVKKIRSYLPPLSFALLGNLIKYHVKDKQLLIHHPPECVGPLVQVYYDVFNQFLHDYHNEDLEMGKEHYQWTLKFINEIADIYPSELERSKKFREKFRQLFGEELKIIRLDDESSNDGVLECNFHLFSVLRLLAEIKNEIGTAGPWVYVLEVVYVKKPIVDLLTDFIPLISTNIRNYADKSTKFTMLVDQPDKLLWKAITKNRREIVVKFMWRYNQRAYELCSEIGKVPKLLYISKEVDGFYMVIIDYVKAKPLYNCSNSLSHNKYKMVFEDIEEAISKLHKKNIIFADLRDLNILVNKSQDQYQGMLIDFDWAGAEDRKKLSQKHDMHWLKLLKSKYLGDS
ncbi:28279_t:CDS:2, partial [Racocetra persica]